MTTTTAISFRELLSTRAKLGLGAAASRTTALNPAVPIFKFGGGFPDPGSFPFQGMIDATVRMLAAEGADAMTYGEPQGYLALRELVAHKYDVYERLKVDPANIVIANGSGHALSLAMSAFLDVGDAMICEAPTFSGTLFAIRRHGPEVIGVPVDKDGIVTGIVRQKLEELRRQGRSCKLIYTIVNFQNPSGPTMTLHRRRELVALAQEFGTLILEDDAYGELRFEGEQLPSLYALDESGCVIRSGTLSKILGAGVRLGWLLAPKEMIPVLQSFNYGGGVSPYMSRVCTFYMRDHMEEHVKLLIDVYHQKRDAMLRGLWEVLEGTDVEISKPEGGFFIWIKLPSGTDRDRLAELASAEGVVYVPGASFFPSGGGEEFIRLAYSFETVEKNYTGSRALAQCIIKARRGS